MKISILLSSNLCRFEKTPLIFIPHTHTHTAAAENGKHQRHGKRVHEREKNSLMMKKKRQSRAREEMKISFDVLFI